MIRVEAKNGKIELMTVYEDKVSPYNKSPQVKAMRLLKKKELQMYAEIMVRLELNDTLKEAHKRLY
jgi:uncharacterized Fe-S cluster-containing radical SAM superfamily protein